MKAYCVFCKTGEEKAVAQRINALGAEMEAVTPVRVMQERRDGNWELHEKPLIPGYVFVFTSNEFCFDRVKGIAGVYRLLTYPSGERALAGSDEGYALWIYKHQGRIETTHVLCVGSEVKVVDGPLMDGIGTIVKLDRHKRKAWVEFDFNGRKQKVTLSVTDISA